MTPGGGVEMMQMAGATARDFGGHSIIMTDIAEKMTRPLAAAFEKNASLYNTAFQKAIAGGADIGKLMGTHLAPEMITARAGILASEVMQKGIVKTLGIKGTASAIKYGGARVGVAAAGSMALAAVPGLNLIFAADMAYQLAKLGGLAVKSAINLGRDGLKSMQGTINSGVMGGKYQDDEVRATSRARGVAAIQNSRLNARSLLGSEGAMMAAHYG